MTPLLFSPNSPFLVLYTTNITSTHSFFLKLGADIKELEKDKVVVVFGPFELHYILDSFEPVSAYHYITSPDHYGQGIIFYLESSDLVLAKALVIEAGGTIQADIYQNHWGYHELLVRDPNGYNFALYQAPPQNPGK